MTDHLDKLRRSISRIDEQISDLVARRMKIAVEVAKYKEQHGLPIKDYGVEKQIIDRVKERARNDGIYESLNEQIFKSLIEASVRVQDETIQQSKVEVQKGSLSILIIGGGGGMGRWLCQFFVSLGHSVSVVDPVNGADGNVVRKDSIEDGVKGQDVIILSVPLSEASGILEEVIRHRPSGVIFDICSLKSPLRKSLAAASEAGLNIASVHPMFGPQVKTLVGRNILFCTDQTLVNPELVKGLFAHCSANLIEISLDAHDHMMSYVLGAAHLNNLLFGHVLRNSGLTFGDLELFAGTTFGRQIAVTKEVMNENRDLYFEIQSMNDETPALLKKFEEAIGFFGSITMGKGDQLKEARRTFIDEMESIWNYLK